MSRQELSKSLGTLRKLLGEYFSVANITLPEDFMLREFAFQLLDTQTYVRHHAFTSLGALRDFLIRKTPRNSYYSAALYRDPAAPNMEDKGWMGSELMFDIDSDRVPGCEPQTIISGKDKVVLIDNECLELGKQEVLKLMDILEMDFGFSREEIRVYFSGNKGFHVVVRPSDESWLKLTSYLRKEIVDYVKGVGLSLTRLGFRIKGLKGFRPRPPDASEGGWRGRLARAGLKVPEDNEELSKLVEELSVHVDEQVTQDVSRLVRIPGTVNGKSGLPVITFENTNELRDFKLTSELSPFRGEAVVKPVTEGKTKLRFLDLTVTLLPNLRLKVPLWMAVFLSLNGLVEVVELRDYSIRAGTTR